MGCAISKDFSTKINHSLSWVRFLLMTVFIIKGCHGLGSWFNARHVTCSYCYKPMPLSRLYLLYFVCIDSFEWNKSWHKLYKKYKFPKTAFCCDFSHLHIEATLRFCPLHRKIIWTLRKYHKTTSEHWQRKPGTRKGNPLFSKGGRTKYIR